MAFDWDNYEAVPAAAPMQQPAPAVPSQAPAQVPAAAAASPQAFNWDEHPAVAPPAAAAPSEAESAMRGAAQGATMGFSNRIEGAGNALMDKVLGNDQGKSLSDLYNQREAQATSSNAAAQAAHPYIYGGANLAGGVGTGLLTGGMGATTSLGRMAVGAGMGAAAGVGYGNPSSVNDGAAEALKGALVGGAVSGVAEGISNALNPSSLKSTAENMAEKATGATGKQRGLFTPNTGRELLDRDIVNFGSSPSDIAGNAQGAMDAAEAQKSGLMSGELSKATVDSNDVYDYIRNKISAMSGDPSKAPLATKLESKLEDITNAVGDSGSEIPLGQSEEIRRGFDKAAKWSSNSDSNELEANKIVANAYREAGEDAAKSVSPEAGQAFKEAKTTQHILIPAQEAAEKRADVLNQSPIGGLLDIGASGVGASIGHAIGGGPLGTVVGAGAGLVTKALRPRLASMGAVSADKLADVLRATPAALGPWAEQLTQAMSRGATSLGATNYVLMQTNSDYRQHMENLFNDNGNNQAQ